MFLQLQAKREADVYYTEMISLTLSHLQIELSFRVKFPAVHVCQNQNRKLRKRTGYHQN